MEFVRQYDVFEVIALILTFAGLFIFFSTGFQIWKESKGKKK